MEATNEYQCITHSHSHRSFDYNSKLSNVAFQNSLLAEVKPLGNTKASCVSNSLLHLLSTEETIKSQLKNGMFFLYGTNTSKHRNSKMFQKVICYCMVIGEQSIICLIVFKIEMKIVIEVPEKVKRS